MKRTFLTLVLFSFVLGLGAQKKAKCVVITQSGTEITGYIKRYKPTYQMAGGFDLLKNDKKMRIYPKNVVTVTINDTLVYHPIVIGNEGTYLMHCLMDGKPLSLYEHLRRREINTSGNGATTAYITDFYLKKKGEANFVDLGKLRRKPEVFFPNAPALQETIKATKKKDIALPKWVKQYNEIVASQ
ncbi:hypothetical protein [Flagellimonas sp. S3867]|uniref:hypothetical protein n=1 Tax=Flagellimonas sp. S3867 TaxID=2768063 RepID=UPI0016895642|nr:hypothetical protein [Flagellimonas sp. S3867]